MHLSGLSSNAAVVLFDADYNTLVVSPMDNFKSAVHTKSTKAWETGISSEIDSLPPGFVHRTLLVSSGAGKDQTGITATLGKWGDKLRGVYGTNRINDADPVINSLSYWTDNGA